MPRPLASHRLTALAALVITSLNAAQADDGALRRYEEALIAAASASAQKDLVCAEAESQVDEVLANEKAGKAERQRAQRLREQCRALTKSEVAAREALAGLRKPVEEAMAKKPKPVPERENKKEEPKDLAAGSGTAPSANQISALLDLAAKSQAKVATATQKLVGLDDMVKKAKTPAMKLDTGDRYGPAAIESASDMLGKAELAFDAAENAQKSADAFFQSSLNLRACETKRCTQQDIAGHFEKADQHRKAMEAALELLEKGVKEVRLAALHINATEADLSSGERDRYIALENYLTRYPSARKLMGGDAVSFGAAKGKTDISLKVGGDYDTGLLGTKRFAVTVSAPLGGSDRSTFFDIDQGFGNTPAVTLSMGSARATSLGGVIYNANVGLTVRRDAFSYLEEKAGVLTDAKDRKYFQGLTLELGLLGLDQKSVHTLRATHSRGYEAGSLSKGKVQTLCPGGVPAGTWFQCKTGYLGAPSEKESTTLGWGVNFEWEKTAIAPMFTWERGTRRTRIELPIYLIKNADKKTGGLNAGIQIVHERQPAAGGNKAEKDTGIGLFIGSPFDLLSTNR